MKTKINKSQLFKKAWYLFKTLVAKDKNNKTDKVFSECLRQAWQLAKNQPIISIESLYKAHYQGICNFIFNKLHNIDDAQDLTNEVFVKAIEKMHLYNSEKSGISTWLYNIANNVVIDFYRDNCKHLHINVGQFNDDENKEVFQFADSQTIENVMDNNEISMTIEKAMAQLKPKYQKIAEMYFIKDKPYSEIADLLELPLGSVKGAINRIRAMLTSQAELKYQYQNI